MPLTQTDVPARPTTPLAPPLGAGAIASPEPPRASGLAQEADAKAVREPFDFNEYVEYLQYAEWGWF